jgi:uncharacterized protein
MYDRSISLSLVDDESCFLWGARQTGKSTLLKSRFDTPYYYDLLRADRYRPLLVNPSLLREELDAEGITGANQKVPIIIDEVQKIPDLLDEVHWLIENRDLRFILCGSSARKLKRGHANLLGGRAVRYELLPLTCREIPEFDLERALSHGLLPRMYDSKHPDRLLQAYVSDYLREEITAEAVTRNIPAFSRFLDVAAMSNGEIVNYQNIASECGVSAPTAKEYFQIVADTLIGSLLPAYRKRGKRRVILAPRFYYFDIGVTGYLSKRGTVAPGSSEFGKAFEHLIYMELRAHAAYSEEFYPIAYWRTASGFEVDFIIGDGEIAVEVKSSEEVKRHHLKGLRAFKEEHSPRRAIVVSRDRTPRKTEDGIEILPWREFLRQVYRGL